MPDPIPAPKHGAIGSMERTSLPSTLAFNAIQSTVAQQASRGKHLQLGYGGVAYVAAGTTSANTTATSRAMLLQSDSAHGRWSSGQRLSPPDCGAPPDPALLDVRCRSAI